jgi:hypothetical protein
MIGPADEVERRLRLFVNGSTEPVQTAVSVESVYSAALAGELVERITDDARKALLFIAENGPQVSLDAVQEHLGMDGTRLGGVMASFGFAEKSGLPRPFRKDGTRRLYIIEPEVAASVIAALGGTNEAQAVY